MSFSYSCVHFYGAHRVVSGDVLERTGLFVDGKPRGRSDPFTTYTFPPKTYGRVVVRKTSEPMGYVLGPLPSCLEDV